METGLFLAGYAVARMSGELFRQPDPQLGYLIFGTTMGQLLSIPVLIAGIVDHRVGAVYPPPVNAVTAGRGSGEKIARRIRAEGPLSVAAYMAMVLLRSRTGLLRNPAADWRWG